MREERWEGEKVGLCEGEKEIRRDSERRKRDYTHLQTSTYSLLSFSFLSIRLLCCCSGLGYIKINTPHIQHLPLTLNRTASTP